MILPSRAAAAERSTQLYEFFDDRNLGHLWFIAVRDGTSVQMLVPTFQSERAARLFEYCYHHYPGAYLLSIDAQLELARRVEAKLDAGIPFSQVEPWTLCEGLSYESAIAHLPSERP